MSKFTQTEETMIVKNAMELTATIKLEEKELRNIKSETFRCSPKPPERRVLSKPKNIQPQYPPKPKTTYSYTDYLKDIFDKYKKNILFAGIIAIIIIVGVFLIEPIYIVMILFCSPLLVFSVLVASCCTYYTKRNTLNQELSKSPEYLQAVENAKKDAEEQQNALIKKIQQEQEKLDAEYEDKKRHYEDVTIPEYNKELHTWKMIQEKKITFLEEELQCNNEALNNLYDASKLISLTYRELWILKWLYDDMSTSDHDIRYATELLDRDRQRLATEESGRYTANAIKTMDNTMKTGFNAVYNAIDYGNELQEDSIKILSKTRRDNNIGNLIGTFQRHHTNKTLDALLTKK